MATFNPASGQGIQAELIEGIVGTAGTKIKIIPVTQRYSVNVPMFNITGDGDSSDPGTADTVQDYEEGIDETRFSISGYMLSGSAIGLTNMRNTEGSLTFRLTNGHTLTGEALIQYLRVSEVEKGNNKIQVAISGILEGPFAEDVTP